MATVLITGMPRAGTTLLQKLLSSHPRVSLLSQPFPLLFPAVKSAFLATLDRGGEAYPLGDLFLERGYTLAAFCPFLDRYEPSLDELRSLFTAMQGYSGQYTRLDSSRLEAALSGTPQRGFAALLSHLYRALARDADADWVGGKEVGCEEFLPCLLDGGLAGVMILRDPRDILASLNHGRGADFAGDPRPTLFIVRQWRKSVAFALHLRGHPRFASVRYEDVVVDPARALSPVAGRLGVDAAFPLAVAGAPVPDESGEPWRGNSSHGELDGLTSSSVGAYRRHLPPGVIAFVEATCRAEMAWCGYTLTAGDGDPRSAIEAFVDPYESPREHLRRHFDDPRRRDEEVARLEAIAASDPAVDADGYFIFADVLEALRKTVS